MMVKKEPESSSTRKGQSKVLRWYGSVAPKERPEDFRKVREEFEQGVAEEIEVVERTAGMLKSKEPPLTAEELREVAEKAIAEGTVERMGE